MCAVCNGRTYGGGFYAAPEAQPDDGWLDVFIIRRVSRLTIARLLGMYKSGRHFRNGELTEHVLLRPGFFSASRFRMTEKRCHPERSEGS